MRDRDESHGSYRERPAESWESPGYGPLVPSAAPGLARPSRMSSLRRSVFISAVSVALLVAMSWARSELFPGRAAAIAAPWDIDLTSAGAEPVTALVFGREAGVHLVRLPSGRDSRAVPRRVPASIGQGDVYMVSLGWSALDARSASPPGSPRMAFAAHGRFVKMFQRPSGTGISTYWW
jgi:hypothetical protein